MLVLRSLLSFEPFIDDGDDDDDDDDDNALSLPSTT